MNGRLSKIIDIKARPKARAPQARYIFETVEIKKIDSFKKMLKKSTNSLKAWV